MSTVYAIEEIKKDVQEFVEIAIIKGLIQNVIVRLETTFPWYGETDDDRTRLQALALINDCYKYIMDLTTNGVVITDAIKFVQTNREKLTIMSTKEDENGKESKEPDYDEDKDQLEEEQEEKTGETTNHVF